MVIHDHIILFPTVDVEGYPFNPSKEVDGTWRIWRTQDLHPSSDYYAIRPFNGETGPQSLFRRIPPLVMWTTQHEGVTGEVSEVVESTDYWRHVRFSGVMRLHGISEDNRHYHLKAVFESGVLNDIWLEEFEHNVSSEVPDEYSDIEIEVRSSNLG